MPVSIQVPDKYGYVLWTCIVGPMVAGQILSAWVMSARKRLDVPYPNLYATPGIHKNADEFNRVQRGHQSMMESLDTFTASALVGGLKHPIATAVAGALYSLGCVLYGYGYKNMKLDVKKARLQQGGGLKYVGLLTTIGTCISMAGSLSGWW